MATAFDTLATYDAIAASGLDEKAARAISKAIADSAAVYRADLATKSDLAELRALTKSDLAELGALTKSDLAELGAHMKLELVRLEAKIDTGLAELRELIASTQNRTLIWMFGMLVTFSGVIIAAVKLV